MVFLANVALGVGLSVAFFMFWVTHYPMDYDPKNIDYVLWKHGHNQNMNLDDALAGMTHDVWPVNSLKGLTKDQLKEKFGTLKEVGEARPYDQRCYQEVATASMVSHHGQSALYLDSSGHAHEWDKEAVFLRESDWMAVLNHGKTIDLVLCKGF
jgi:ABC-type nickel/cobalt efflux system permease component RcnA